MLSYKVVVIKNNRLLCEALKEYLCTRGFEEFYYAISGEEGLKLVKEIVSDVVVVGTRTKGMSATHLFRQLE